jgi:hypothetical protein
MKIRSSIEKVEGAQSGIDAGMSLASTSPNRLNVIFEESSKEKEVGILDTVLRKREPAAAHRTTDGGHPAPYPDMTDAQLYNYELAFNVPRKTFDRPPPSLRAAKHEPRFEPQLESITQDRQQSAAAFEQPFARGTAKPETGWRENDRTFEPSAFAAAASARQAEDEKLQSNGNHTAADPDADMEADIDAELTPSLTDEQQQRRNPSTSGDTRPLDLSKPVRTITTKQSVEIITTRARHPIYKVHGYIDDADIVTVFTLDGQLSEHGARFLENVPDQQELYLNIYPNHNAYSKDRYVVTQHETREEADAAASAERVACVKADLNL